MSRLMFIDELQKKNTLKKQSTQQILEEGDKESQSSGLKTDKMSESDKGNEIDFSPRARN